MSLDESLADNLMLALQISTHDAKNLVKNLAERDKKDLLLMAMHYNHNPFQYCYLDAIERMLYMK